MLVCKGPTLLRRRLDRVCAQNCVDVAECCVEAAGQSLHARSGAESDKGNNKSILDQILTFLAVHQILELHIQLDKAWYSFVVSPFSNEVASKLWIPLQGTCSLALNAVNGSCAKERSCLERVSKSG